MNEIGRLRHDHERTTGRQPSQFRKSTGPGTAAGKARSSANATVHGSYSNRLDLVSTGLLKENLYELALFVNAIVSELAPTSVLEQAAARSVAQRLIGQARANRLGGMLIDSSVVASEEPLVMGTARFKVAYAHHLLAAVRAVRGEANDPQGLARLVHGCMKAKGGTLLVRRPGELAAQEPATSDEWRAVLPELLKCEYGGLEGTGDAARRIIEEFGEEARKKEMHQCGVQAARILENLKDLTALHERVDRAVDRALTGYYALQELDAASPDKLPLNGTVNFDEHEDEEDDDEEDEEEEQEAEYDNDR